MVEPDATTVEAKIAAALATGYIDEARARWLRAAPGARECPRGRAPSC